MVYSEVHSWCCKFCGFRQCLLTCNHRYHIIQKSVIALNIFCAFACSSLSPPKFVATTDFFTIIIVFPFPECYIVGVVQSVPFSDGLLFHLVKCI